MTVSQVIRPQGAKGSIETRPGSGSFVPASALSARFSCHPPRGRVPACEDLCAIDTVTRPASPTELAALVSVLLFGLSGESGLCGLACITYHLMCGNSCGGGVAYYRDSIGRARTRIVIVRALSPGDRAVYARSSSPPAWQRCHGRATDHLVHRAHSDAWRVRSRRACDYFRQPPTRSKRSFTNSQGCIDASRRPEKQTAERAGGAPILLAASARIFARSGFFRS